MTRFNRILCPVDLSANSLAAIKLATTLAKAQQSKIVLMYVAPQWLPEDALVSSDYVRTITEEDKKKFEKLAPHDSCVEFEHVFRHGNAGPEIVRESKRCDMVVMSTHGYGAMLRFLMGGVAQYVMRNAKCPVVTIRVPTLNSNEKETTERTSHFVTEVMHQVAPIHKNDNIDQVLAVLDKANESAAAVVDNNNVTIGILTKTDIANFRSLKTRFDKHDESVIKEMFKIDKYGHVTENVDFDKVCRHMSSPAVTISNSETIDKANEMFAADQSIHHLVVVDESQRPVGILEQSLCKEWKHMNVSKLDASQQPESEQENLKQSDEKERVQ